MSKDRVKQSTTGENMKKCRLSILSSLVLASLSCPANSEEVIYSQLPDSDPNSLERYGSFEPADAVSGQRNDQMTADNFILTDTDAIITGLRWWGGSDVFNSSDLDNFSGITVKIFTNVDHAPDSRNVLYEQKFRFNDTNPEFVSFSSAESGALVYEHHITFNKPLELCKGDEYWITIGATNVALASSELNITTSENGYMWYSAGARVDDGIWVFNFSDFFKYFPYPVEWSEISGDQSFVLYGEKADFLRATHCPDHGEPDPTDTPEPTETQEPTPTISITPTPTPPETTETQEPTPTISITPTPTATPTPPEVPIPAAVWLFGSGLAGLFAVARKRKSKS